MSTDIDREVHLAKCKARALRLLDQGFVSEAVVLMLADISKHEETAKLLDGPFGTIIKADGMIASMRGPSPVRSWIEGFE
jgi:hypothetical protein